ncbi:ATP-grasp domain-containing protein [Nannocystis sp. ILAH1]|uniref:ATP-grasp domain-containing protein n=1 Tax=unclassified Nannocystis TaxID=2627009 RepID=UPI00226F0407|nr:MULTISPECIES: ATP-grasp domain-containing protein [unclassified Nannocystis]MCY0994636.1 ATP-grasp domain-containing protein [Nannocystis sp. ILAH1]MCY1072841.1 ATP-grasp domain-containing protein [Nannocystis sp. RBIL2]
MSPSPGGADLWHRRPAMLAKIYVQRDPASGEFINKNVYNAWYGFTKMGVWAESFVWSDLYEGRLALERDTAVIGGILTVRTALAQLGAPDPINIDYPSTLASFLRRRVRPATIREAHALCRDDRFDPPVFIKPVTGHKEFTGHVLAVYRDLLRTAGWAHEEPDTPVWLSDCVEFVAEWRYFVHAGEILGVGHYYGDPLRFPDPEVVRAAVAAYTDAPAAYVIDFGVLADGSTALVEVNDGFSFGCYGLNPYAHARMLTARWLELVGLADA